MAFPDGSEECDDALDPDPQGAAGAHLLTGRLAVAFACTVVLAVGVTLVASLDYSTRMQAYRTACQQTEAVLEKFLLCFGKRS